MVLCLASVAEMKAIRGRFSSISAIAIGLGYGFAAILVHSLSDFGQHIPSDAALTAVTCGLLASLARQRRLHVDKTHAPEEYLGNTKLRVIATVLLVAACAIAIFQAQAPIKIRSRAGRWNSHGNTGRKLRSPCRRRSTDPESR